MKICFVTTGDITSLATMKRATGMANPLIDLGYEVAIVAENNPNNLERFELECPKIKPLLFEKGSSKYEVKQKKQLIKNWSPDIVYVCTFGLRNWIHKLNASSRAVYLVEHSELVSAIPNNKKRFLYKLVETLSTILFDGQIYASKYLEEVFSNGIKKIFTKKQPTLYSPYAYNKELSVNFNIELLASIKKKHEGKKVVLYMGTLAINYGFLDIIKVAEIIKDRGDFIVLIMGNGRHKAIGQKYIEDNNLTSIVELLGYIPEEEVSTYFKLADAFVSPLYDTIQDKARCPSKLFMYIPFSKPVITCKIGESKELFKDSGYYYKSGNIDELATLMVKVLDEKKEFSAIDINKHTWEYRTKEFDKWIRSNY